MKPNKAPVQRLTATLSLQDPEGLHCRVAALLAYRLRVEAPDADITLHTLEGREADPKMPLQTITLEARHSGVVLVQATGSDAAKALEIIRSIIDREPLSREEVIAVIPKGVGGDIGEIRANQQRLLDRALDRADRAEVEEWKSPGGWLWELMDDVAPAARNGPEVEGCGVPIPGL